MSGSVSLNGRTLHQLPSAGANPTLTINGHQINAQQIRPLMVDRATASTAIQNNGLDEIIVNQNGQDYLIAGRGLRMSDLGKNRIPAVQLNGQPAELVDFNDEVNSWGQGAVHGARNGWRDMADTTISAARTAVGTLGAGGSIAAVSVVAAGGIYGIVRYGGNAARGMSIARAAGMATGRGLMQGGLTTMKVIGIAALAGTALVTGFGAVRGASEAANNAPNWSSLARLTDSRAQQGGQGAPAAPAPVATVPVLPEHQ